MYKQHFHNHDTIFALASAAGKAGVCVYRISGPKAAEILDKMVKCAKKPGDFQPRFAYYCDLVHPNTTEKLDSGLIIYFKNPASFTGEDVVEFFGHGSTAVSEDILQALSSIDGFRFAKPGEFTRRAFENGKMDLTEAEGLADLINAQTSAQKNMALKQMDGGLSDFYKKCRSNIVHMLAEVEAYIDFPDEDVPQTVTDSIQNTFLHLKNHIETQLKSANIGERMRNGFRVALIGPPNVGKSSLINRLTKRDIAIVSPTAGTTRDVLEAHLDLNGYPVIVSDTAGLRQTAHDIEEQGIIRAKKAAQMADLVIFMADENKNDSFFSDFILGEHQSALFVQNKIDLIDKSTQNHNFNTPPGVKALPVSVKTTQGLDILLENISNIVAQQMQTTASLPPTRPRHTNILKKMLETCNRIDFSIEIELVAEDVRLLARQLGELTGEIDIEDVYDHIFDQFCIGK